MREGEKSGGGGGGSPETGQYQGSPLVDTEKADTEDQGKAEMARQRFLREETETAQRRESALVGALRAQGGGGEFEPRGAPAIRSSPVPEVGRVWREASGWAHQGDQEARDGHGG